MRDYARISSRFWTGPTGKAIRRLGPEAQVIACYLISAPGSNMIGLYYLPLPTLCHETGVPFEGASKALRSLQALEFAFYDSDAEVVWLPEMAEHQIAPTLKPEDNRVKSICKELATYIDSMFYGAFVRRYGVAFSLPSDLPEGSPFEAPSKPLRSQEQEQEQEKEQKAEERSSCPTAAPSDAIARPVNGHAKVYPADFMAFYAPYPKHEAKDDALKAWKATAGARPPIEEIVAAIEAQKKSDNWRKEGGKFIPLPATWLRAGRWADSLGIEGVQLLPLERPRQAPSFPEGRHYAKL